MFQFYNLICVKIQVFYKIIVCEPTKIHKIKYIKKDYKKNEKII